MSPTLAYPGTSVAFSLPAALEATEPPEARGLARDQVRLLVARRGRDPLVHTVFRRLPDFLDPGDLLVVNNSATMPAAVAGTAEGAEVELHLSNRLQAGLWVVEPRRAAEPASEPLSGAHAGLAIRLAGGGRADLLAPYGTPGRLWVASLQAPGPVEEWLAAHGRPIRYRYVPRPWPLDYYQTVFAQEAGSAEMPSAGRPFSAALVTDLVSRGVAIAPVTLHCGVSSQEAHEAPMAEWFQVPAATADVIGQTRRRGNRVIAVGTTVVRALETAADERGVVHPAQGWTELVVDREQKVAAVDGMITGWHEPAASHLAMLEAVAGPDLLARSYRAALDEGYRWHEFGDSHLILR